MRRQVPTHPAQGAAAPSRAAAGQLAVPGKVFGLPPLGPLASLHLHPKAITSHNPGDKAPQVPTPVRTNPTVLEGQQPQVVLAPAGGLYKAPPCAGPNIFHSHFLSHISAAAPRTMQPSRTAATGGSLGRRALQLLAIGLILAQSASAQR